MLDGKSRAMGLGAFHTVSLAEARDAAQHCRKLLRDRIDPIEQRKRELLKARTATAKVMTFMECADAYINAHEAGWRNAKHASQWRNTLRQYAYPIFGDLPVSAVDTGLVLKVLEPIWRTKTETASRVRGRIESVLDWATVRNLREGENPARWRGHLDKALPKPAKVRKVAHHAALPYDAMGDFMTVLRARAEVSARGLEFLILTAARTGEVIGAKWGEIDLEKGIWVIPAERMKARVEHRVPLSGATLSILKDIPKVSGSDYVFPGARQGRPVSNMVFLQLLKRMRYEDITAHGFRSTFRDWAAERTAYPREVAERALAHTTKDKTEAAYQRGDLFEKRRHLMEAWAAFCGEEVGAANNVTPLRSEG